MNPDSEMSSFGGFGKTLAVTKAWLAAKSKASKPERLKILTE
jgi:hypothetical protein